MKIEQIYTGCLAEAAYYIESNGQAVIIDPLRETQPYLDKLKAENATLKYIFETHFHADFVSGHLDLAKATGATIVYGPNAKTAFEKMEAKDGQILQLGELSFKVLHTPGHTPESTTYLLLDENGKEKAIFTGDTLFIGDVGRPDLAQKSGSITKEDLAGWLFDSLRNKIMPLPDEVIVYPAHGAGSACGKNMSSETWDSLGNQKATNYALRADMTREEFIQEVTAGLLPPPNYFAANARLNKMGYDNFETVLEKGAVPLSVTQFQTIVEQEGALILDTRHQQTFKDGFIPGSIFIGIDGSFAPWAGALIPDLQQAIVFLADEGREEEVVTRLSRVGFDRTLGYLKGGVKTWQNAGHELDKIKSISVAQFEQNIKEQKHLNILDVRKPTEFLSQHIETAQNTPLDYINQNMEALDPQESYFIHCKGGYRSMIFSSILRARGFQKLIDIDKGWNAIEKSGIPLTGYVCPSEMPQERIDEAVAAVSA
ncbi:MAG: MBL fold metallo-hydrolase [Saprospiraceae bacterium]